MRTYTAENKYFDIEKGNSIYERLQHERDSILTLKSKWVLTSYMSQK